MEKLIQFHLVFVYHAMEPSATTEHELEEVNEEIASYEPF